MANESYEEVREEENGSGFSFSELFRAIGKKIWWILGISVAVALIVGLVNMFALKPGKIEYEMTFMLEYPNSEDRLYPDGTPFRYESIIYSDRLAAVKESDESFANIDVDKMTTNRNISITEATRTEAQTVSDLGIYTIKVKGSYFTGEKQASEFLRAVCDNAVTEICNMVEKSDFSANLKAYEINKTFSDRISRLESQQSFLLAQYDKFMEQYGSYMIDGKAINAYRSELSAALDGEVRISALKTDLELNRYLCGEKTEDILLQIRKLENDITLNASIIAAQEDAMERAKAIIGSTTNDATTAYTPYTTKIAELEQSNKQIQRNIDRLYLSISYVNTGTETDPVWTAPAGGATPIDNKAFAADMDTLFSVMTEQTETCKNVVKTLFQEKSRAVLQQNNVSVSGGQSTILLAAVGFVGAFIVASLVFYCIARIKQNSKQVKETEVLQADAAPELKLEAAVADDRKEDKE